MVLAKAVRLFEKPLLIAFRLLSITQVDFNVAHLVLLQIPVFYRVSSVFGNLWLNVVPFDKLITKLAVACVAMLYSSLFLSGWKVCGWFVWVYFLSHCLKLFVWSLPRSRSEKVLPATVDAGLSIFRLAVLASITLFQFGPSGYFFPIKSILGDVQFLLNYDWGNRVQSSPFFDNHGDVRVIGVEDVVRLVSSKALMEGYFILISGSNQQVTYTLATAATVILLKIRRDIESKATFVFQTVLKNKFQHLDLSDRSLCLQILADVAFFPFIYTLPDTHLFMLDKVSIRTVGCLWYITRIFGIIEGMLSKDNRSLYPKISMVRAAFSVSFYLLGTFKAVATATDISICLLLCQLGCCAYYLYDGKIDTDQFSEAPIAVWFAATFVLSVVLFLILPTSVYFLVGFTFIAPLNWLLSIFPKLFRTRQ